MYGPPGGRRLVAFVDDLNMPARTKCGAAPALELIKLWADHGFWWAGGGGGGGGGRPGVLLLDMIQPVFLDYMCGRAVQD